MRLRVAVINKSNIQEMLEDRVCDYRSKLFEMARISGGVVGINDEKKHAYDKRTESMKERTRVRTFKQSLNMVLSTRDLLFLSSLLDGDESTVLESCAEGKTYAETGKVISRSRERVRQILCRGIHHAIRRDKSARENIGNAIPALDLVALQPGDRDVLMDHGRNDKLHGLSGRATNICLNHNLENREAIQEAVNSGLLNTKKSRADGAVVCRGYGLHSHKEILKWLRQQKT
jgi:hypothetical protein